MPGQLLFLFIIFAYAILLSFAQYTLVDDFSRDTFFGNFTAFTDVDPTNGFVDYISYASAAKAKIIQSVTNANDASYIGVDSVGQSNEHGRKSMRLESKKSWTHGLFIIDLLHMPINTCGTWPAFWLVGPSWPNNGEIDIIEGVNSQDTNQMTLHTAAGCKLDNYTSVSTFSGTVESLDCGPGEHNQGCAVRSSAPDSFGRDLNAANGGVYATEWTSRGIKVWFFPRSSIPTDVQHSSPEPNTWALPQMAFPSGPSCDIDKYFGNMKLVFNTAFCGDWAGKVWQSDGCAASTGSPTCERYVQEHPEAYVDTFWLVNYVKVYKTA